MPSDLKLAEGSALERELAAERHRLMVLRDREDLSEEHEQLQPEQILAVVGKRGSGKSSLAKAISGAELDAGSRIIGFDPKDEMSRHGRVVDGQVELGPLPMRLAMDDLRRMNPEARHLLLVDPELALAVVPRKGEQECAEDFKQLLKWIEASQDRAIDEGTALPLVFFVEELGIFYLFAQGELNYLGTQSRHMLCAVVFVAQRMTQIPLTARTQITRLATGLQNNPDDLDAIAKLVGVHHGKPFAAGVARLPRRKFLEWRDSN